MKIRARLFHALRKVAFAVAGDPDRMSGVTWADQWRTQKAPTAMKLVDAYREMAYACANINATAVASVPLRLFATNPPGQRRAGTLYHAKQINKGTKLWLESRPAVRRKVAGTEDVEEIFDHPILTLLEEVNQFLDGFTLLELTDLFQEMVGRAYWYLEMDPTSQMPKQLWILPPQYVTAKRNRDDPTQVLSHYEYATGNAEKVDLPPEKVIAFQFPNLRDPYLDGWSPARAAWETINLLQKDGAYAAAMMDNRARPDVFVSSKDGIGIEEQYRLEQQFHRKFGRGGSGGIMVGDGDMKLDMLAWPPKDLEALARSKVSLRRLANMFGVPITFLETETVSRANAEAGHYQHAKFAVLPRLTRFCQVLNHALMPRYSDRLFIWFDDPVPADQKLIVAKRKVNLDTGVATINEERAEDGKPPVPWGDKPWLRSGLTQPSDDPEANARNNNPPPMPPGQEPDDEEELDKQKPDQDDEGEEKNRGNLNRARRSISGSPRYPRRSCDASASPEEVSGAVWSTLCLHGGGELNRSATVDRLRALGVDPAAAVRWTEPVLLAEPGAVERDAEVEAPDWHTRQPEKAGHRRRLPRGIQIKQAVLEIFRQQRKEVFRKLGVQKAPNLDFTVDLSDWDEALMKEARPAITIIYEDAAEATLVRLGVGTDPEVWDVVLPEVREAVDQASMKFSASTNATTSKEINTAIRKLKQDLAEGIVGHANTPSELSKRVGAVFNRAERFRAERIAITEASRATHGAQRIAGAKSGVVKGYKWLLSGDACEICQSIAMAHPDGIGMTESFAQVGSNPEYMSVQQPPAHPYCMCTMTEILAFEEPKSSKPKKRKTKPKNGTQKKGDPDAEDES